MLDVSSQAMSGLSSEAVTMLVPETRVGPVGGGVCRMVALVGCGPWWRCMRRVVAHSQVRFGCSLLPGSPRVSPSEPSSSSPILFPSSSSAPAVLPDARVCCFFCLCPVVVLIVYLQMNAAVACIPLLAPCSGLHCGTDVVACGHLMLPAEAVAFGPLLAP